MSALHVWKLDDGSMHWIVAATAEAALERGRERYGVGAPLEADDPEDAAVLAALGMDGPVEVTCVQVPDDEVLHVHFPDGLTEDETVPEGGTAYRELDAIEASARAWAQHVGDGVYIAGTEW